VSEPTQVIRIGVSQCLMGDQVRFNGGHSRDRYLTGLLSSFVEFVPVCPEVDIGLGIPRETIRLERSGETVKLVAPKSATDLTRRMRSYAKKKAAELAHEDLSGFVLKKDSPSCGLFRVRIYDNNGVPSRSGRGVFAEELCARLPQLPVEEDGRLNDPALRENFLERVFAYRRLKDLFRARWKIADLVQFQTREKLLVMAHDPRAQRALGQIVAKAKDEPRGEVAARYKETFMGALEKRATPGRHANTLNHMASYFKEHLPSSERQALAAIIDDYRKRLTPLIVPLTLVRHYVRKYEVHYLAGQSYLEPHPKELMLRNHV
jgi:uncharacterized protein YbgA (DUF1722 family)/uncharacterized protein YbbK (DUF523 family)